MNYSSNLGCAEGLALIVVYLLVWGFLSLLFAYPVMWLWNWLMPAIFHLPTITALQALGLNVLSSFLFKSSNITSNSK